MDIDSKTILKGPRTTILYSKQNGQWVPFSTSTTQVDAGETRTIRKGAKTANFRNPKLRPSPLPYHRFTYDRYEATSMLGEFTSTGQYGKTTYKGYISGWTLPGMCPAKDREVAINSAIISLRSKIKDMKINLGQVYAERNQVANLIGDVTTGLASQIRQVNRDLAKGIIELERAGGLKPLNSRPVDWRKSKNRFAKNPISRRINAVASAFLAIQYGVRPLLSDVHSAAETLAKAHLNLPPPLKFNQKRQVPYTSVKTVSSATSRVTTYTTGKLELRAQGTFDVDGALSVGTGIGLLNPALLAWELLPFSFVVDWFFKIGAYVNSWDATLGCNFKAGGISIRDVATVEVIEERFGSTESGSARASARRIIVSREPYTDFPRPQFPLYNDGSSLEHMANGLGLLAAAFSGSTKK